MQEGEAIESRMVSRRIEGAQKKVEERNFEVRKNLLEYDEVMDEQRKRVYGYRQRILDGANCKTLILEMIDKQIEQFLEPVPGQALRRGDVRQLRRQPAWRRARAQGLPRPGFRDGRARGQGDRPAHGRRPGHRHDRREPARRGRPAGVELGSAGPHGQHALEAEPARSRPEEGRPRGRGRVADREGPRGDRRRSISPRGASSWSPTLACARPAAGCSTSSASS